MKQFLNTFQETGICELKVGLLIKKWKDNFSIYTSDNKEYRFAIDGKKGRCSRVTISEEQAVEIIKSIGLLEIKSPVFNSARTFRNKSFIENAINKTNEQIRENVMENNFLNRHLKSLTLAILQ